MNTPHSLKILNIPLVTLCKGKLSSRAFSASSLIPDTVMRNIYVIVLWQSSYHIWFILLDCHLYW